MILENLQINFFSSLKVCLNTVYFANTENLLLKVL